MRRHSLLLVPVVGALAAPAGAQDVPFEKYVLENGLTVILHEDHALPQVVVNLWYRVGSKDEEPGRSGFAHLFEHLMFMGTERVPGSGFDDTMEGLGGWNNASTSTDRTNYFDVGPAEILPTLLWLEADRLQDVGRTMTQEKLDLQREVVRNERRQTSENQPYGRAYLEHWELMYPEGHPYHHSVIGSHEDLQAATVDDVKDFFATYYVPSNASLVVAGDFDPEEVKPRIERLFGTLPRGADVVHRGAEPVERAADRTFTMTDRVQFARTALLWHSPVRTGPGDAELDLLAEILAEGTSSRLYERLVIAEPLAIEVGATQHSRQHGSIFTVDAMARPGVPLERLERAIDEVLADLVREGPTEDELARVKARYEASVLDDLQSLRERADRLNELEFLYGDPGALGRDLDRYRDATPAGVLAEAREVLSRGKLVMRVLPEAEMPEEDPRDEPPPLAEATSFQPASPETFELSNGISVQLWDRPSLPIFALRLVLPRGSASDPEGRAGLAALTADMLDEGAGGRSAAAFADALSGLGGRLDVGVEREWTEVRVSGLSRNLDATLALAMDALEAPAFDEQEWERVHELHLAEIRRSQDDPADVAGDVLDRVYFGERHPYGVPVEGTLVSAGAVTLDEARARHAAVYRPEGVVLLVAGDLSAAGGRSALERAFAGWRPVQGSEPLPPPVIEPPPPSGPRVVLVDRPGAVQTVVSFRMPAPSFADPERSERELLATVLGGTFTSRLNRNLREEKGYTYGARARFESLPSVGWMAAGAAVRADVTGASIAEFLAEFRALRSGDVSAEEAAKARSSRRLETVTSFGELSRLLRLATRQVVGHAPFDGVGADLARVAQAQAGDLNALAGESLPLEELLLVLVGDERTVRPQLEGLGLPEPELRDARGEPVADR